MPTLLYVLGIAPNKLGCVERFCEAFAIEAKRRNWNVVFAFEAAPSAAVGERLAEAGAIAEVLPNQGPLLSAASWGLFRLLRRHRPERVVYGFNGALRTFPWLARLAGAERVYYNDHSSRRAPAKQEGPCTVNGERGASRQHALRTLGRSVATPVLRRTKLAFARLLCTPLDGTVCVSHYVKAQAQREGFSRGPLHVIHNGVPSPARDATSLAQRGADFRRRYDIPLDAPLVTQVSWLVPEKGIDVFLRAAQEINRVRPEVHFALVGTGSHAAQYRALAAELGVADRVHWPGHLHSPSDEGVFAAATLCCQLSVWAEAFGATITEAMAEQRAVVASRIGGIPEIVAHGETGLLVPPGDSRAAATALLTLLADEPKRQSMGLAARQRAEHLFGLGSSARAYCDLLLAAGNSS